MRALRSSATIAACLLVLAAVVVRAADEERRDADADGLVGLVRDPPLTLVEAGLAALALLVLAREVQRIVLRWRPRAVEVHALGQGEQDAAQLAGAWPALVKATLHKLGALPEPSVPNGAIQPTALSLVDIELPAQANAVAGALHFVADRFRVHIPHRVTATLLPSEDGRQRLVMEMVDADTGQLEAQHRIEEPTLELAARRAGCLVYQDVAAYRDAPAWERWGEPHGASLMEFLAGTEAETALNHVEALQRYQEAARAEPSNVIVHLRLGNLQERQKLYEAAMQTYARTLVTWPRLVQPRHRLAITMVAIAMDQRVPVTPSIERTLALLRTEGARAVESSGDPRIDLLKAAQWQWDRIADAFRFDRALAARLRREAAIDWRTRKGIKRGPMRRNAKVASVGIKLYILQRRRALDEAKRTPETERELVSLEERVSAMTAAGPVRRLARRVLRTAPDFRAHYNCACFYSILLEVGGERTEYVKKAVEQLREVLRTAERDQVFGWALDDQDLAPLWRLVEQPDAPATIAEPQLASVDLLRHQLAAGPTIRHVEPAAGAPGDRVVIRGINFDPADLAVTFGTATAPLIEVRTRRYDTEVEVEVPPRVEPGEVGLAVQIGGRASETRPFNVRAPAKIGPAAALRLSDELHQHGFVLSGATIPIALERLVVGRAQAAQVRRAAEVVLRVIARFCDAYPRDARLRDELDLPSREDALVRLPFPYSNAVQIGRFDGVLSEDGSVRFVELNADTPASMGYADVAHQALESVLPSDGHRYDPMIPSVAAALLLVHRSARRADSQLPVSPRVAIVDRTTSSWHDVEMAVDGLHAQGIDAVRVPPDGLRYDGSRLEAGGAPVDLVYRRMLLEELEDGDVTAAARDGRVVVVNAFRSRVANNKKLLALLDDPRFSEHVKPAELSVVRAAIPWTRIVRDGPVRHGDRTVDLQELCVTQRERLVLKPAVSYAGQGVHIGLETPADQWEALVHEVFGAGTHVVQELVVSPERTVPVLEDGVVRRRRVRVSVSPFVIGGRYAGMMARIADRHMVNLTAGGAFLPCVESAVE